MTDAYNLSFSIDLLADTICWKLGIEKKSDTISQIHSEILNEIKNILQNSKLPGLLLCNQSGNDCFQDVWKNFLNYKETDKDDFNTTIKSIYKKIGDLIHLKFPQSTVYYNLIESLNRKNRIIEIKMLEDISALHYPHILGRLFDLTQDEQYRNKIGQYFKSVQNKNEEVNTYLANFLDDLWKNYILKWINERSDDIKETNKNDTKENPQLKHVTQTNLDTVPSQNPTEPLAEKKTVETTSLWKYLKVPENLPDKHEEYASGSAITQSGFHLFGARVRGKKHKHEGTNCDDWFEIAVADKWTIIAVSDGAGSKKLSRVGAKASCQRAIEYLKTELSNSNFPCLDNLDNPFTERDPNTGEFPHPYTHSIEEILHKTMTESYAAVEKAFEARKNDYEYSNILGRPLEFTDLSGTLLIAIHTLIDVNEKKYHFVIGCHVGDGMMAVIAPECSVKLLAIPDSGEFSGETDFLTSSKRIEKSNLKNKTFAYFGPMNALLVMSDGVSDDYFPNTSRMIELYGDLVLNEIIPIKTQDDNKIKKIPQNILTALQNIQQDDFAAPSERIQASGNTKPFIRSISKYAEKLGLPIPEIFLLPSLLEKGRIGIGDRKLLSEDNITDAADRLKIWLDSYYVKGSFDDRTLVVLDCNIPNSSSPTLTHSENKQDGGENE